MKFFSNNKKTKKNNDDLDTLHLSNDDSYDVLCGNSSSRTGKFGGLNNDVQPQEKIVSNDGGDLFINSPKSSDMNEVKKKKPFSDNINGNTNGNITEGKNSSNGGNGNLPFHSLFDLVFGNDNDENGNSNNGNVVKKKNKEIDNEVSAPNFIPLMNDNNVTKFSPFSNNDLLSVVIDNEIENTKNLIQEKESDLKLAKLLNNIGDNSFEEEEKDKKKGGEAHDASKSNQMKEDLMFSTVKSPQNQDISPLLDFAKQIKNFIERYNSNGVSDLGNQHPIRRILLYFTVGDENKKYDFVLIVTAEKEKSVFPSAKKLKLDGRKRDVMWEDDRDLLKIWLRVNKGEKVKLQFANKFSCDEKEQPVYSCKDLCRINIPIPVLDEMKKIVGMVPSTNNFRQATFHVTNKPTVMIRIVNLRENVCEGTLTRNAPDVMKKIKSNIQQSGFSLSLDRVSTKDATPEPKHKRTRSTHKKRRSTLSLGNDGTSTENLIPNNLNLLGNNLNSFFGQEQNNSFNPNNNNNNLNNLNLNISSNNNLDNLANPDNNINNTNLNNLNSNL